MIARLILRLAAVAALVALAAPARADDVLACNQAGAEAEASLQLPPGLLRAIGRVESGRRDPASGVFAPWPYTINANGQGRFFPDAASAIAAVRALQAEGTVSIDTGCFQVNLMHHPLAFRRIEEAFDPAANAAYAGSFLLALRQRLGGWEAATAAYHSATAERGEAYRARVFAAWNPAAPPPAAAARPTRPMGLVIRIADAGNPEANPEPAVRVWSPARPGAAPARVAMPAP